MAVRSGAGTGVVVSLVVFILTTVFLLVLTIVFYSGKTKAMDAAVTAESELAEYVKPSQRNSDAFKRFEQSAGASGKSVVAYLKESNEDVMRFLNGDATAGLEQVQADFTRLGVQENDVVRHVLEEKTRDLRARQVEVDSLKSAASDRDAELREKEAQIARMKEAHRQEIDMVSQGPLSYQEAAEIHQKNLSTTIDEVNDSVERLTAQYELRVADLQNELDESNQEAVLLRARVDEYASILNVARERGISPELLVDGNIMHVEPANETVFIDRGKNHRIVLGMTFEVYDDFASIRPNRQGVLPRGKASIQVVKVTDTTSTCKITRSIPGRPVVRNNVIANAIYDPEYRFKFLVHGKFDVDGDGRPSEAEAEYLRSLIIDWGAEVVIGNELPGDLDFLVLGVEPPIPPLPPATSTQAETRIWVAKKMAAQQYADLYRRASEAQIPVLNANRFFILIGHTDR